MYALAKAEPSWAELIAARDGMPAVRVLFAPVSPKALRQARRAVTDILRAGGPAATEDAGDAFTAALIRAGIRAWEGIVDENQQAIEPTPDREILNDTGKVTGIELGTISAFLAEPRLVEAADREYVVPWAMLDAEKNGFALSPNGTSAGATKAGDIASSPATQGETDGATTTKPVRPRVHTTGTKPRRKKAKPSGS